MGLFSSKEAKARAEAERLVEVVCHFGTYRDIREGAQQERAVMRLVQLGEHAVGPIVAALEDGRANARPTMEVILSAIGEPAVPAMTEMLAHGDGANQLLAATVLGDRDGLEETFLSVLNTQIARSSEGGNADLHVVIDVATYLAKRPSPEAMDALVRAFMARYAVVDHGLQATEFRALGSPRTQLCMAFAAMGQSARQWLDEHGDDPREGYRAAVLKIKEYLPDAARHAESSGFPY
ncbi:MAG: hypothetical protein Q7W44_01310 [Coriobacteriia bacterium]|nr:hypothetical protein [Coriobacteriia bacterium]